MSALRRLLREPRDRERVAEQVKGRGVWCQEGRCRLPQGSGLKASLLTTWLQRLSAQLTGGAPNVGGVGLMLGGGLVRARLPLLLGPESLLCLGQQEVGSGGPYGDSQ